MTIDEAIKYAEEAAEEQEKEAKEWHENQVRKCELIPFAEMDYTHENECKKCADEDRQLAEWLKDYKQLKEQEPCEDCVSREKVWYMITGGKYSDENDEQFIDRLVNELAELSSVTPQQKTGHWIYDNYNWRCSECNETPKTMGYVGTADFMTEHFKFCNHCG